MRKILARLAIIFISWRAILLIIGFCADRVIKYSPSFPYASNLLATSALPRFLYSWANFDGVHYITIAQTGYLRTQFIQAFFPLLPTLIHPFYSVLGLTGLLPSLILVNLFAFFALVSWYLFLRHFFSPKIANLGIWTFLLFPTSLYLGALYTEGLFLGLVLCTFILADKKYWLLATLCALLASSTRIVGIFLVPALLIELYMSSKKTHSFSFKTAAMICFGSLGLLGYMLYLKIAVGDPLAFFHAQSSFGAGRQTTLVIYPQVIWRSLKILLTNSFDLKYLAYIQEFIAGTFGLIGIILGYRISRASWMFFALCAFFLPTLTGTFSSMSRYLLVCFPLFIFLTKTLETRPRLKIIWLFFSSLLLILNTLLFIQGYWVA